MTEITTVRYPHFERAGLRAGTTLRGIINEQNFAIHTRSDDNFIKQALTNRIALTHQEKADGLVTLRQTHSDIIHILNKNNLNRYLQDSLIEGDALVTDLNNVLIGVLTADCAPLLYFDPEHRIIAICHAGWKGLHQGIHQKVLDTMAQHYQSAVSKIQVVIGPLIRGCCYDVGKDFLSHFDTGYFREEEQQYRFDMPLYISDTLRLRGVLEEHIFDSKECVYYNDVNEYFSYRKGDTHHRILSFIGISGKEA